MWDRDARAAHGRIDAMERRIDELAEQVHAMPDRIEKAIHDALAAHESRDNERARAMADQITSSLSVSFLGEDLATGPDAARNRRALQQILRQGVMIWPIVVRMQTRLLWLLSTAVIGLLLVSFVGAGTIIDLVRLKVKVWFGS